SPAGKATARRDLPDLYQFSGQVYFRPSYRAGRGIMVLFRAGMVRQNRAISRRTSQEAAMNRSLAIGILVLGSCAAAAQETPPTMVPPPTVDDSHASSSSEKA